jgi:hypothetical protein
MICWMFALFLAVGGQEPAQSHEPQELPEGMVWPVLTIDGSREPERLPAYDVWENLFWVLQKAVKSKGGRFDASDSLSVGIVGFSVPLSRPDMAILLPAVAESWARIEEAQQRRRDGFTAKLGDDAIRQLRREVKRTILRERNAILSKLSPNGVKALMRFEAQVRAGMALEYSEGSLAATRVEDAGLDPQDRLQEELPR